MQTDLNTNGSRVAMFGHLLGALTVISAALLISGCNTTEGVGKDIKSAGEALEDAADDAKD